MQPDDPPIPDPLVFLKELWQSEDAAPTIRVSAAVAALPFLEARLTQESASAEVSDAERVQFGKEMVAYLKHQATPDELSELADAFDRILQHCTGETVTVERRGHMEQRRPRWRRNTP